MGFREIGYDEIKDNPFSAIGSDWMLIAAGDLKKYNMMTASWGAWGVLWHKPVCFCFIRPQRYTYEFMEAGKRYCLCYFEEKYRKILDECGARSGRDFDKMKEVPLTAQATKSGAVYFAEARLVIECEKIYYQQILPQNFLAPFIEENYPNKDYHRMYVGEVKSCLFQGR